MMVRRSHGGSAEKPRWRCAPTTSICQRPRMQMRERVGNSATLTCRLGQPVDLSLVLRPLHR